MEWNWQKYGNAAQWISAGAALVVAVLTLLGFLGLTGGNLFKSLEKYRKGIKKWIPMISIVIGGVIWLLIVMKRGFVDLDGVIIAIEVVILGIVVGVVSGLILKVIDRYLELLGNGAKMFIGKIKNRPGGDPKWKGMLVAVLVTTFILIIIVAIFSVEQPTITRISEIVEKEGYIIAQKTKEGIIGKSRDDHEKIIITLADAEATRKVVYRDALWQAEEKGYIFSINGWYLTGYLYRDVNSLLTEKQQKEIESCFIKHTEEKDLHRLLYCVLSDEELIKTIKVNGTDIFMPSKDIIHLSPYHLIGVVGGYLGEIRFELLKKLGNDFLKKESSS